MKTFGVWLKENQQRDLVIAAAKYKIVHGDRTPDGQHNEKMGRRMAAKIGLNFDQVEAELQKAWKPGLCPTCGGIGYQADYSNCFTCASTGLQGMSPQQAHWWLAKHKELEALSKHHFRTFDEIHGIPKSKLAKDIVTAAHRAGVPKPEDMIDWGEDEEGYNAEYYQGHEQDFYIGGLEGLLRRIAEAMFKKAGHKAGAWG